MEKDNTKTHLISSAKTIFIKKGFEEATMSDIAKESGFCRRTIYSYFPSKFSIYQALIDRESMKVIEHLTAIADKDIAIQQKIIEFIYGHFYIVKETVDRNGTLRSPFFRNIWGLEHFRKGFDQKEMLLLQKIISEGKTQGVFDVGNVKRTAEIIHLCMRGFEVPYIRGQLCKGNTVEEIRTETQKLIFGALGFNINKTK